MWKFVIPNFNKLIIPIENSIIPSTNNKIENIFQKIFPKHMTNNKIENIFQKIFPKHIKRRMKIEKGLLTRFMLKLNYWNVNNAN